ncbi:hypothetical protein EPN44_14285 [bacterium]|nr:MAG: hypothetical protein EPN44_14285 [bacterium]
MLVPLLLLVGVWVSYAVARLAFKDVFSRDVRSLFRVTGNTRATWFYATAAAVLVATTAFDIWPTSQRIREVYAREGQLQQAKACLDGRLNELGAFELRQTALERALQPYRSGNAEALFLTEEEELRREHPGVTFVHVEPPRKQPINAAGSAESSAAGGTSAQAGIVAQAVVKAADCVQGLETVSHPMPVASSVAAAPPIATAREVKALEGETFEFEVAGRVRDTLAMTAEFARIPIALETDDLTFQTTDLVDKGKLSATQVPDAKATLVLYHVVLPTAVPTVAPASPSPQAALSAGGRGQ